jgi:type IV pilus assembly protein PilN
MRACPAGGDEMSQLNLLPWRDLRRQELDRQVRNIAIGVAIAMTGLVFWGYSYMNTQIEFQKERNAYLQKEIKKVDEKLKEIKTIRKKRAALLARMEVIQKLQSDRTRMVEIFDGLARNLPAGMFVSLFQVKGKNITLKGSADSNGTVSKFMSQIEKSDEFTTPNLNIISVKNSGGIRVSNFTIKVRMKDKKKEEAEAKKTASNKRSNKK